MSTRTVTYTINRLDGSPWASARLSWQLVPGSFDEVASYPRDRFSSTTDENGEGSVDLWINESGALASVYRLTLPSGETAEFTVPAGEYAIDLTELRALGVIDSDWTAELLSTAILDNPDLQGPAGEGVPAGGTTGQVLAKNSNTDFDTEWVNQTGGGGGGGDMFVATYDPQGIEADAFDRANHTGAQAISTVTGLQTALDGKETAGAAATAQAFAIQRANHTGVQAISTVTGLQTALDAKAAAADLTAHIDDTTGAHAATAISNTPSGSIAATTVQAAIDELATEKEASGTAAGLIATHEADTTSVHGITDTSALVTLTGSQTLTNKTLTSPVINTGFSGSAIASQAEAEAGSATDKLMNPLRTAQAIAALAGGGGPPSGSAGGVLSGTYPNPDLAASVAGSGLAISSNVLSVGVDDSTVEVSADALRVKALGITDAHVATANKDGADGTASMRTLGTGAAQAAKGNHTHAASAITFSATGDLSSTDVQAAIAELDTEKSSTSHNHDSTYVAKASFPVTIGIAPSDETTALTTGTAKATFRMPHAMTLTAVRASVTTAPTGSTLIVDINEAGTTILSTKLSIDASEKTSTTAASAAVISDSALADDAEITIDIDQIGSSVAGAGLKVWLIGTRSV